MVIIMWRLWNKLFGWDYIYWESSTIEHCITSRIRVTGDGIPYFTSFKYAGYLYKVKDHLHEILWLTCKPEKYLGNHEN